MPDPNDPLSYMTEKQQYDYLSNRKKLNNRLASGLRAMAEPQLAKNIPPSPRRFQAMALDGAGDTLLHMGADAVQDPWKFFVKDPANAVAGLPGNTIRTALATGSGVGNFMGGNQQAAKEDFGKAGGHALGAASGFLALASLIPGGAVLTNSAVKQFFGVADYETAQLVSHMCGETTIPPAHQLFKRKRHDAEGAECYSKYSWVTTLHTQ